MVLLDNHETFTPEYCKKAYRETINAFSAIPLGQTSLIVNVIASYFGRKYLNKRPEAYQDLPSQDVIDNVFKRAINKINSDIIVDQRYILNRIRDYVNYYRTISFHEYSPDGRSYPIHADFGNVDKRIIDIYYNFGYSLALSPSEYLVMVNHSEQYKDLSRIFSHGAKFLKQYIDLPE